MYIRYTLRCLFTATLLAFTLPTGSAFAQTVHAARQGTDPVTDEPVFGSLAESPPTSVSAQVGAHALGTEGDDLTLVKHVAGGETRGIALDGTTLYRSNGGYFEAVDVTDPTNPELLSRIIVETSIVQDVRLEGELAYVVSSRSNFPGNAGLHIVDISDPSDMEIVGEALGQSAYDAARTGDYAIAGAGTSGVAVYDVSDPTAPLRTVTTSLPGKASALKVALTDDIAFVSAGNAGVATLDISNPTAPVLLDTLSTDGFATKVKIDGNVGYALVNGGALLAIDLSDPSELTLISQLPIESSQVRGLQIVGGIAYVSSRDAFQVLDVSDPTDIREVSSFPLGKTGSGQSIALQLESGLAYVGNRFDGVRILDGLVQSSSAQGIREQIAQIKNGGFSYKVFLHNGIAYISDLLGEYRLIDVSDPERAEIVGRAASLPNTSNSTVRDGIAYVVDRTGADTTGITRFDVSDPTAPTPIDTFTTGGQSFGIDLSGDEAYVANGFASFLSVGLDDGMPVSILDTVTPTSNIADVRVRDDIAYVSTFSGMLTIDTSDPSALEVINVGAPVGGFVLSTALDTDRDGLAYLADGQVGLNVVDISDPAAPLSLATGDIAGIASGVAYSQGFAYIADEGFGLRQYDVTDPEAPTATAAVISSDRMTDVDAQDGLVVAVDAGGGVYIFRARDNSPVAGAPSPDTAPLTLEAGTPNPFRDQTTLRYHLPSETAVTLEVFDGLGRRVATLVDAEQVQGAHEVSFDADGLPSGTYLYRLTAGDQTKTRTITLMR